MAKSNWKIDTEKREARNSAGLIVRFQLVGRDWLVEPRNNPKINSKFISLHTKRCEVEALAQWDSEMTQAIGFLTLVGMAVFGDNWIEPLANEIEVKPNLIRDWLSRMKPLAMSDPIWPAIMNVLVEHRDFINVHISDLHSAILTAKSDLPESLKEELAVKTNRTPPSLTKSQ